MLGDLKLRGFCARYMYENNNDMIRPCNKSLFSVLVLLILAPLTIFPTFSVFHRIPLNFKWFIIFIFSCTVNVRYVQHATAMTNKHQIIIRWSTKIFNFCAFLLYILRKYCNLHGVQRINSQVTCLSQIDLKMCLKPS